MVVVGAGSSTRFGSDKLLTDVVGRPLITHTVDALLTSVDVCVVVCGPDVAAELRKTHPDLVLTPGGRTRTHSEMAGLAALEAAVDLIGIHDAARPAIKPELVERLFAEAARTGGAVPVLDTPGVIVERENLTTVTGLRRAQTPQVFRGPDLRAAYERAEREGFEAFDTAEVMQRFSNVTIVGVAGDPANIKVTFPDDIELVTRQIIDRRRSGPR